MNIVKKQSDWKKQASPLKFLAIIVKIMTGITLLVLVKNLGKLNTQCNKVEIVLVCTTFFKLGQ